MTTREQFEAHFAMPEWMKKRDAMDEYLDEFAQLRWEGWQAAKAVPEGWKLVPVEPTEKMVIAGFESAPTPFFSEPGVWEKYVEMTGCQQAAFRARLCYAAMLAAAAKQECA